MDSALNGGTEDEKTALSHPEAAVSQPANTATDGHIYWNGEGGEMWVRNLDRTEANMVSMATVLLARAAPRPGERVLDIGCGGGTTSRALAAQVAPDGDVVAVDISETILRVAREPHGGMTKR